MKSNLDRAIDAVLEAHPDLADRMRYPLDGCSDEDIGSGEAMRRLMEAKTMIDEREEA